jgi:hypothetical protein
VQSRAPSNWLDAPKGVRTGCQNGSK